MRKKREEHYNVAPNTRTSTNAELFATHQKLCSEWIVGTNCGKLQLVGMHSVVVNPHFSRVENTGLYTSAENRNQAANT